MERIIILVVAAAWAAVLIPPLLRSRVENRPNSSVVDFRRQLSSLQRTVPTRGVAPMRGMARPLAPAARPGLRTHHGQDHLRRSGAVGLPHHQPMLRSQPVSHPAHRQTHVHRNVSRRHQVRQRRQTVLFVLVATTAATAFLAFTTKSTAMVYVFVLAALSLVGYCYQLVQLKHRQEARRWGDLRSRDAWF